MLFPWSDKDTEKTTPYVSEAILKEDLGGSSSFLLLDPIYTDGTSR